MSTNKELLESSLNINPTWAICVPSNCTKEDVFEIMKVYSSIGFQFASFVCQTAEDVNVPLSNIAIMTMYVCVSQIHYRLLNTFFFRCVLFLIAALMCTSTIYEIRCVHKKLSKYIY